ncbi:hypothetical protein XENOCAPTIV_028742, partial [Xenoophorus captivus]
VVTKYSNFVSFPIFLNGRRLNTLQALWMMEPKEISDWQHEEFYRYIAQAYDRPRYTLHYRADAPLNIRSIFYVPDAVTDTTIEDIAKLLRFESSALPAGQHTNLMEYGSRMKAGTRNIYYLCAPNRHLAEHSPYFEAMKKKDMEVLFCYEQFDELTLLHLREFDKKKLISVETDIVVDHYKEEKFEDSKPGGLHLQVECIVCSASQLTPRLDTHPAMITVLEMGAARHFLRTQQLARTAEERAQILQPTLEINAGDKLHIFLVLGGESLLMLAVCGQHLSRLMVLLSVQTVENYPGLLGPLVIVYIMGEEIHLRTKAISIFCFTPLRDASTVFREAPAVECRSPRRKKPRLERPSRLEVDSLRAEVEQLKALLKAPEPTPAFQAAAAWESGEDLEDDGISVRASNSEFQSLEDQRDSFPDPRDREGDPPSIGGNDGSGNSLGSSVSSGPGEEPCQLRAIISAALAKVDLDDAPVARPTGNPFFRRAPVAPPFEVPPFEPPLLHSLCSGAALWQELGSSPGWNGHHLAGLWRARTGAGTPPEAEAGGRGRP